METDSAYIEASWWSREVFSQQINVTYRSQSREEGLNDESCFADHQLGLEALCKQNHQSRSMRSFMPSIMSKKFYSDKALNWFSPWPPSFSFLPDPVFCKRNRLFNFCRLSLFSCPSPFWRQAWSRQQVIVLKADVHRHFFFFLLIKNGLYEFYILWKEVTLGVKKIRHFYFQERSRVEWNRAVTKILR